MPDRFDTMLDRFDKLLDRFDKMPERLDKILSRFDTTLCQFKKNLDGWIKKNWPGAILLIRVPKISLLAPWLEILKRGVAAAPLASIHQLPAELIIEILLSALEGTVWDPKSLQRLASVCKDWRDIILSNPRFWTVIDTRHGRYSSTLVLKRNRVGPLYVNLRDREGRRHNTNIISHLVRLLSPESRRIRALNFEVNAGTPYFRSFFETTSLPSLTHLTVSVIPQTAVPVFINIDCGPLRYLSLDNAAIRWDTALLYDLETLSLSKLNQDTPTIAQLHHILSSTPFLRELSIASWNA
ncbi:hypothetical protein FRC00_012615 [Tulasnella sp. 408]|nr:hypothetical protein FRC00_012615 [Tulasnella sp. 408]